VKKAAFYLVASVIFIQLLVVSGVLIGCFRTGNGKCTGDKAAELMTYITTQSFALYAAEK
tara:strand:- start:788 stop:967 length:180 start_codon:yes stop_codon:yes gene_type:complete